MLRSMPTLDDGGMAVRQTGGDPNRGIEIPGAPVEDIRPSTEGSNPSGRGKEPAAVEQGSSDPSGKGKQPAAPPPRRLVRGDGTFVGTEPAAKRQRTDEGASSQQPRQGAPSSTPQAPREQAQQQTPQAPQQQEQQQEQQQMPPPPPE